MWLPDSTLLHSKDPAWTSFENLAIDMRTEPSGDLIK